MEVIVWNSYDTTWVCDISTIEKRKALWEDVLENDEEGDLSPYTNEVEASGYDAELIVKKVRKHYYGTQEFNVFAFCTVE